MPNHEVASLERELAHEDSHRARLQQHISNRFTPHARNDIVSEIRYVESRRHELRQNDEQIRNIINQSRNREEIERGRQRRDNLRQNMDTLNTRYSNATRRLHEYDAHHKKNNDELAAVNRKIGNLRERLHRARQRA